RVVTACSGAPPRSSQFGLSSQVGETATTQLRPPPWIIIFSLAQRPQSGYCPPGRFAKSALPVSPASPGAIPYRFPHIVRQLPRTRDAAVVFVAVVYDRLRSPSATFLPRGRPCPAALTTPGLVTARACTCSSWKTV